MLFLPCTASEITTTTPTPTPSPPPPAALLLPLLLVQYCLVVVLFVPHGLQTKTGPPWLL